MRRQSRTHKRYRRRSAKAFRIVVAVLAALVLLMRLTLFHTVRIEGISMEDTLRSGDLVLVTAMAGEPERFDVLECSFPGRSGSYIKRLIGLPGETVELRNGICYIDGQAVPEPFLTSLPEDYSVTLGDNQYLMLGDNRAESYDSREADMGPIPLENISGQARFVLWPPRGIS